MNTARMTEPLSESEDPYTPLISEAPLILSTATVAPWP